MVKSIINKSDKNSIYKTLIILCYNNIFKINHMGQSYSESYHHEESIPRLNPYLDEEENSLMIKPG